MGNLSGNSGLRCSCGTMNEYGSKYCIRCGKPVDIGNFDNSTYNDKDNLYASKRCSCGAENDVDSTFCVKCGKKFINEKPSFTAPEPERNIMCSSCGVKNKITSKFCVKCGNNLNAAASAVKAVQKSPVVPVNTNPVNNVKPQGKFCGVCGTGNTINSKFCVKCGNNLTENNVPKVSADAAPLKPVFTQPKPSVSPMADVSGIKPPVYDEHCNLVVCDCGAINSINSARCGECGAALR